MLTALLLGAGCNGAGPSKGAAPATKGQGTPAPKGASGAGKATPAPASIKTAIALRDVTVERVPQECRGEGRKVAAKGLLDPVLDMAAGVAVVDLDGEDGPDVLSVVPGLAGVCALTASGDKPYRRIATPEGAPRRPSSGSPRWTACAAQSPSSWV